MVSASTDRSLDRLQELLVASQTAMRLYDVALYGQGHREVNLLNILRKLGSSHSRSLRRRDLQNAINEVEAIERAKNSPTIKLSVSTQEIKLLRRAIRLELRSIRRVPNLARQQVVIALSTAYEGFVSDVIREIFDVNPMVLKSKRATLKDEELVEALHSGDALNELKVHRLRDVMYGSVSDWYKFMTDALGMKLSTYDPLRELFLVRNAIVHSNSRISKELTETGQRRFKHTGRDLNVAERDIRKYSAVVDRAGRDIWAERKTKFIP